MHDRGASAIEVFCHNRDFSVATNLDSYEKENPRIWGITAGYQSIGIRIPRADGYVSRLLDSLSYGVAVCTSELRYVIA